MIPWHVASGMSGIVMVLPRDGLKDGQGKPLHYDSVYYIGENDFYVPRDKDGKFKRYGSPADPFADTLELMKKLIPSHVVFEGRVDSLTGDHAMPAKVGEMVLMLHSQAIAIRASISSAATAITSGRRASSPIRPRPASRPGSSAAARPPPRSIPYMIEAVELGAFAHFKVDGKWNDDLMTQVRAPEPIKAEPQEARKP